MTRRAIEIGAAVAAVSCLAACGSNGAHDTAAAPTLPRTVATALAARSDAVADALAAGDSCNAASLADELQRETIAAINRGGVASVFQEPLSTTVNDLVARVICVPPPQTPAKKHGKHEDHGNKHKERD